VERGDGVETKPIKTSYVNFTSALELNSSTYESQSPTAGTAFITFDNVKVPIENTLGPEGGGIFVMLSNFNHERWVMICSSARSQRFIVEECLKWTTQRKVFGKPLHSQAVIRSKLAAMISRVESVQNWLESITYQMNNMVRVLYCFPCLCEIDLRPRAINNRQLSLPGVFEHVFMNVQMLTVITAQSVS
jgi:hypothetical protein